MRISKRDDETKSPKSDDVTPNPQNIDGDLVSLILGIRSLFPKHDLSYSTRDSEVHEEGILEYGSKSNDSPDTFIDQRSDVWIDTSYRS